MVLLKWLLVLSCLASVLPCTVVNRRLIRRQNRALNIPLRTGAWLPALVPRNAENLFRVRMTADMNRRPASFIRLII